MASICVRGSSLVARSKIGEAGSRFWIVVSKVVLMDSDKTSHHWLIRGMYTILGEVLIASRNICKQDALIICIQTIAILKVFIFSISLNKIDLLQIWHSWRFFNEYLLKRYTYHLINTVLGEVLFASCNICTQDTYKDNTRTSFLITL